MLAAGQQLLPERKLAQAEITGTFHPPGWEAPIVSDLVPKEVWEKSKELFAPYEHLALPMRNGIGYISKEDGDRMRDKFWKAKKDGIIAYEAEKSKEGPPLAKEKPVPQSGSGSRIMEFQSVEKNECLHKRIPITNKHAMWEMCSTPQWMNQILTAEEQARYSHVRYDTCPEQAATPIGEANTVLAFTRKVWFPGRLTILLRHFLRHKKITERVAVCSDDMFASIATLLPHDSMCGMWSTVTLFRKRKSDTEETSDEEEDREIPAEPPDVAAETPNPIKEWNIDEVFSNIDADDASRRDVQSPTWEASFNAAVEASPWKSACEEAAAILAEGSSAFVECSQCESADYVRKNGLYTEVRTPGAPEQQFGICTCLDCGDGIVSGALQRCTIIVPKGTKKCPKCQSNGKEGCGCGCTGKLFLDSMQRLAVHKRHDSVYAECLQCHDQSIQCSVVEIPSRCDSCVVLSDSDSEEDDPEKNTPIPANPHPKGTKKWKKYEEMLKRRLPLRVILEDAQYEEMLTTGLAANKKKPKSMHQRWAEDGPPLASDPSYHPLHWLHPRQDEAGNMVYTEEAMKFYNSGSREKDPFKGGFAGSVRSKARDMQKKLQKHVGRLMDPCEDEYVHGGEHGWHFPQASICGTCRRAAQKIRDHRRSGVHLDIGGLSIDLVERIRDSDAIEYEMILASSSSQHRKVVVAVPMVSKEQKAIIKALMLGILIAEYIWGMTPIKRVHSDREPGLLASSGELHENAVMLTVTEGYNSDANPIAESFANVISRMTRVSLNQALVSIEDKSTMQACREFLWPYAMELSAALYSAFQTDDDKAMVLDTPKLVKSDLAPFLCEVIATRTTKVKRAKEQNVTVSGYYLGPDMQVPVGSKVLGMDGKPFTCTTTTPVLKDGKLQFPKKIVITQKVGEERGAEWDDSLWVLCEAPKCKKWRLLSKEEAYNYDDANPNKIHFTCKCLKDTTCRTKEDPEVYDDDATGRASGRDKNRPPRAKKIALLARVFGCSTEDFKDRGSKSFIALTDWVSEDACVADEGQIARDQEPLQFDVDWSRTTAAEERMGRPSRVEHTSEAQPSRADASKQAALAFLASCGEDVAAWNRIRAHVVKVFSLKEAKKRPKYAETVNKQVGSLMGHHTWGPPDAMMAIPLESVIYRGKLIYGVKNWENPELWKDKARVVVQGCLRITRDGKILLEKWFKKAGEFWAPTSSMAGARFIVTMSVIYGRVIETTDLDSGYCQTSKRDSKTWLLLDNEICEMLPEDWQPLIRAAREKDKQMGGKGDAVFPLWKNLFGECPAGQNFIEDFQGFLIAEAGWHRAPHDHGMLLKWCTQHQEPMAMSTYVDDLLTSLTTFARKIEYVRLGKRWVFDAPYCARKFLGIKILYPLVAQLLVDKTHDSDLLTGHETDAMLKILREVRLRIFETNEEFEAATAEVVMQLENGDERLRQVFLSQGEYMRQVIAKYEDTTGRNVRARKHLPDKDPPVLADNEKKEAGTVVRSAAGGMMYGARGTRLDALKATHVITTRVTTWSDECTIFLEAVLGVLKDSLEVVLVFDARGTPLDWYQWRPDGSGDADHKAPKCYSGSVLCLAPIGAAQDSNKFLPLDFSSVGQRYAKLSPADSEVVAAVHLMRYALRYCDTLRAIHDLTLHDSSKWTHSWREGQVTVMHEPIPDCVVLLQREDNSACKIALERGWSQKLAHISTIYQVSLLWAACRIKEGRVIMAQEATKQMLADPLTKLTDATVLFERGILKRAPEMFIRRLLAQRQ